MNDLRNIYEMIYTENGNIGNARNALEAVLDILPPNNNPTLNKVDSLLRIAAAYLERIEQKLDNACDFTAATERKLAALTD